ncbi:MAG: glucose-6-phosphate isomerase [Candidatus Saccharibacteria bacterium]|nr:glucose-6-phosphate isomerase [Candidatus Saccharibacteria bacterium]
MIKFISHSNLDASILAVQLSSSKAFLPEIAEDPMAGWLKDPISMSELDDVKSAANEIRNSSEYLVCIGIGGSYLGARAVYEALKPQLEGTKLLFAGNSISPIALTEILSEIEGKDFSINVISKSGTTLEPALAFKVLKDKLIEKYGKEEASRRIYATTDKSKGTLKEEADKEGYKAFVVPDNIGGRYSVLTPVGLLPLATAGVDVDALLAGMKDEASSPSDDIFTYAVVRHMMRARDMKVENLTCFEPRMQYFNEWWKQLFGESEGKNKSGLFPASTIYSTDLHSLGQFLQEGSPELFETFLTFNENPGTGSVTISVDAEDPLGYLNGKDLASINKTAETATIVAHSAARPVFEINLEKLDAKNLGAAIYFFELSCAISAKLQGVNPFNQPGVEAYKREMYHLLEK